MKKPNSIRSIILAGSLLLQLSTLCLHSHGAVGDVDLSFVPGSGVNGPVHAVAVRPDGKLLLSWPVTALNFQLQKNTNLTSPNFWSPTTQSAMTNGAQISVTVPTSAEQKFFRLKSQ